MPTPRRQRMAPQSKASQAKGKEAGQMNPTPPSEADRFPNSQGLGSGSVSDGLLDPALKANTSEPRIPKTKTTVPPIPRALRDVIEKKKQMSKPFPAIQQAQPGQHKRAVHTNVSTTRSNPNSLTLPSVIKPSNTPRRAGKAVPASRVELQPQQTELPRSASKPFRNGSEQEQTVAVVPDSETRSPEKDTATDNTAPAHAPQDSLGGENPTLTDNSTAQQDAPVDGADPVAQAASSEPAPEAGPANEAQLEAGPANEAQLGAGAANEAQPEAGAANEAQPEAGPANEAQPEAGPANEAQVLGDPAQPANAEKNAGAENAVMVEERPGSVRLKTGGVILEESDEIRVISTPPRPAGKYKAPTADAGEFDRAPSAESGRFGLAQGANVDHKAPPPRALEKKEPPASAPIAEADGPGVRGEKMQETAMKKPIAEADDADDAGALGEKSEETEIKKVPECPPLEDTEAEAVDGKRLCLVDQPEDEQVVVMVATVVVQDIVKAVVDALCPPSPPPAERRLQALASPPKRKPKSPLPTNVDLHLRIVRIATVIESTQFEKQENMGAHAGSTIGRLLRCTGLHGRADGQFTCMAGVALGPGGLLFVAEKDKTTSHHEHDVPIVEDIPLLGSPPVMSEDSTILPLAMTRDPSGEFGSLGSTMRASSPIMLSGTLQRSGSGRPGRRSFVDTSQFGNCPSPKSELRNIPVQPRTIPVRTGGLTFVIDAENHCLQVLRQDGTHLRRAGSFGKELGQFNTLQGVVVHKEANFVYVADTCNHRVQVLSWQNPDTSDIMCVKVIGMEGKGDGQFRYPVGLALNHDSTRLIVADTGNDRIQIFSSGGTFIRSVGQGGRTVANELGAPCFRSPYDVAVSGDLIFVTDEGNHRVQVVNMEGQLVRSLGTKQPQHGLKSSDVNVKPPPLGSFLRPRNILRGPSGVILVSDHDHSRVQMLVPCEENDELVFRWRRLR